MLVARQDEEILAASHGKLMWRKFRKHKVAMVGIVVLFVLYGLAIFCEFFSPYDIYERHMDFTYMAPQRIHFVDPSGRLHLRPFVYGMKMTLNTDTFERSYAEDHGQRYEVRFFTETYGYRFWGLIRSRVHLFGVRQPGTIFLLGTDELGRDLFSRTLYAARISLSVGLVGVFFSFILGSILGGISGFYGKSVDLFIQRLIEVLISIPTIPFWMALSAALPPHWPPVKVYFGVTIVLSVLGWCGLARIIRGKILELKEEDFVLAARVAGAGGGTIIARHLLPSFFSFLIVHLTLAVPSTILGETALSFLGLGIRPPAVSWGALLSSAQNVRSILLYPWLLIPGLFVIATVLAFNAVGDGLRDAADPYR